MNFLDYIGLYYDYPQDKNKYQFAFRNNLFLLSEYYSIVPPVYDVGFKKIFSYSNEGIKIVADFLNALLYPVSQSIIRLEYLSKEILSNSHIKYNKGTRIVDNAYLALINQYDTYGNIYTKKVILDVEMQKGNFGDSFNERCFDYGTGLRNGHNFQETWVIALCFENVKNPSYDKGSNTYITKELNMDKTKVKMNYVKIFEIYLNQLYNTPNPESVISGELIGIKGREWIKLFCVPIWCMPQEKDDINYCIPHDMSFDGKEIQNAIYILSNIDVIERSRTKILLREEQQKLEEEYKKGLQKGKQEGKLEGFIEGNQKGFTKGKEKGKQEGKEEYQIKILDKFFANFKSHGSMDNIELLGMVRLSLLEKRYTGDSDLKSFANYLYNKGLLYI